MRKNVAVTSRKKFNLIGQAFRKLVWVEMVPLNLTLQNEAKQIKWKAILSFHIGATLVFNGSILLCSR